MRAEARKVGKRQVLKPCGYIRIGGPFPKGVDKLLREFKQTKDRSTLDF